MRNRYNCSFCNLTRVQCYLLLVALLVHSVAFGQWANVNAPSEDSVTDLVADGQNIYISQYVSGVFHSPDNGSTWKAVTSGLNSTVYNALATDGATLLAGTSHGVFRSTNKGNTWVNVYGGEYGVHAQRVAIHGTVFYAWIHGVGPIRSTDNGANWTVIKQGLNLELVTFGKDFSFIGSTVFVGTSTGVFRSDDTGDNWVAVNSGLISPNVSSLTAVNSVLYAGAADGIYRSRNNGDSWEKVNSGFLGNNYILKLTARGEMVYMASNKAGVFASADEGNTWNSLHEGLANLELSALAVNDNTLFTGTMSKGVFKRSLPVSTKTPGEWVTTGGPAIPGVVTDLATLKSNLFATVHDVGIFRSTDNGTAWTKVSGGIASTLFSKVATNQTYAFVGTRNGVFRSVDDGNTWIAAGLSNLFIRSLAVNGSTVFAGTDSGIFRSTDDGATWLAVNNGLGSSYFINDILIHEQRIYAATAFGLYQSADNGDNWTGPSLEQHNIRSLARKGNLIYAGTHAGIRRSGDNGASWVPVGSAIGIAPVSALFATDNWLFAAASGVNGDNIYFSENDGMDWKVMSSNTGSVFSAFAANSNFIFAASNGKGVWRSALGAAAAPKLSLTGSFTGFTAPAGVPSVIQSLTVSGSDLTGSVVLTAPAGFEMSLFLDGVFTNGLLVSTAPGTLANTTVYVRYHSATTGSVTGTIALTSPGAVTQTIPVTATTVATPQWTYAGVPSDDRTWITDMTAHGRDLFVTSSQVGVFRSSDRGKTWTKAGSGLAGSQYEAIISTGNTLLVGNDNGIYSSTDNGNTWKASGLSGVKIVGFEISGSYLFASTYVNGLYRSPDGGKTWQRINNGLESIAGVTCLVAKGAMVFAGSHNGVFRSMDSGTTWTRFSAGIEQLPMTFIYDLKIIGNTVVAATNDNGMFRSSVSENNWSPVYNGVPREIVNIGGIVMRNGFFALTVVGDSAVYAACIEGVFVSTNAGADWRNTGGGLPRKLITALAVIRNTLFAATADSGVWEYPLSDNYPSDSDNAVALETLSADTLCVGAALYVPFIATGTYSTENVFTAQLSDENGRFGDAPTVIGTATASASGTITAAIPAGTKPGSKYRIRIVASAPAVTSESYATNIHVTTAPGKPSIAVNGNILTSNSPSGNQWYLHGAPIQGANGQVYTASSQGVYTVQVANSCSLSPLSEAVTLILAVAAPQDQPEIKLGPNPANGRFSISLSHGLRLKSTEIYTLSGKPVQQNRFNGQEQAVIEVQQLPKGTYLVKIETQERVLYKRIMVQ